jgi:hypothetical protein
LPGLCCSGGGGVDEAGESVTTVLLSPGTGSSRAARARLAVVLLYFGLAALYFAVGHTLLMRYNLFDPDATSRVANAGYVLMSRDPHLSAIGFVWNPLPSLVEVPVLLFSRWWPELRTHGLAGVGQSALFMAAAALVVRGIAMDRGLGSGWRRVAVACFALQPMIVVYGASGMSEAAEIFCLLWCVRYLMRWMDERRIEDLAWAGLALGLGYLARYEVLAAAAGVAVLVAVVAFARGTPGRGAAAAAHLAVILLPIATAVAAWALTGWVVNHELFATLTSQYGNERQVAGAADRSGSLAGSASAEWVVIGARLMGMQPFAFPAAAIAVAFAALSRKGAALAPVVTFGPVLAFAAWGQFSSSTFGWFRFYLTAIPLVLCIALALWNPAVGSRRPWQITTRATQIGAALVALSVAVGFPTTVSAMLNERIGNQQLQFGFNSLLHPQRLPAQQQWYRRLMVNDRLMASYFDSQQLPDGAVLMDTFNTWGVWLSSARPTQFIITSDFDFKAALNRPWDHGVDYLVVSNPAITDADALNIRYPSLWQDGAGFSRLLYATRGFAGDERFRVYEVTGPPVSALNPPASPRNSPGG